MEDIQTENKKKFTIFGISIWRLFAYFIIYSVVGYMIETIFALFVYNVLESRQSFINAAKPDMAEKLYEYFIKKCEEENIKVSTGKFGAKMKINLINNGPVTIILEK